MAPAILLVDDQHDIVRLLHSALDTLRDPDLEVLEAVSGEAALTHLNGRQVDLLVTDYNLPGITGTQLMKEARLKEPGMQAIVITANTDRKVREEILEAGALAVFSKPVPLGDFLGAVERGLGAGGPAPSTEAERHVVAAPASIPDLLEGLLQIPGAEAAFLISRRGKIVSTAGRLRDTSMEVSLAATLAAYYMAALKVAESNRQTSPEHLAVFPAGDQDLVFMAVDPVHAAVLAGRGLGSGTGLSDAITGMQAIKEDLLGGLRALAAIRAEPSQPAAREAEAQREIPAEINSALHLEEGAGLSDAEMDAYWDAAATQHGNKPLSKDVIPYEEARKLGLTPNGEGTAEDA